MVLLLPRFSENQAKPSRTLVIEIMMILHVNIKDLGKSRSDNFRTEKYMKIFFSDLLRVTGILFSTLENQAPQIYLQLQCLFRKNFQRKKILSFVKAQLSPREGIHKLFSSLEILIPELNKAHQSGKNWKWNGMEVGKIENVLQTFYNYWCCRACVKQLLSQIKLLEKVVVIYLIVISGTIK